MTLLNSKVIHEPNDPIPPIDDWLTKPQKEAQFFSEHLRGAEFHWFFIQAVKALEHDLYVPAVSSLLNGIEATLRVTMQQISAPNVPQEPSPYRVLSNKLIQDAHTHGLPVEKLAFAGESNFFDKLISAKPCQVDVEIVRMRNNICHGNVFEFINREQGNGNHFFTPECLRELANSLLEISKKWAFALGEYRLEKLHA
jgi:hypothetical protein